MKRFAPGCFWAALAGTVLLAGCIDVWVPPPTYAFRTVKLQDKGDQKVGTLGAPDLASGHCAMLGESMVVLKPDGQGTLQASTTTTRAGDTWRHSASVFTEAGTTLADLQGWSVSMDAANTPVRWEPRHFRFDPSLYQGMGMFEFQGECY